jgi:hypothetical protein
MKTAFKLALVSIYVQSDKFTAGIKRGIIRGIARAVEKRIPPNAGLEKAFRM